MALTRSQKRALLATGIAGILLIVAGIACFPLFDNMIQAKVNSRMNLPAKGEIYEEWRNSTVPMYFQVYVFDIVNSEEILMGEKPAVIQKGPYTYRENKLKHSISFDPSGIAQYKERQSFVFEPSMSVGTENDTLTTINLSMATIMTLLRWEAEVFNEAVEGIFQTVDDGLFVKMSVYDMLWGYEDPLIELVVDLLKTEFHFTLPFSDKIGLLMSENDTDTGEYIINGATTVLDGFGGFGNLHSWNGQTELSCWSSELANAVNGSMGQLFPPFIQKDQVYSIFSTDVSRAIPLEYEKDVEVHDIPLYRFMSSPTTFANATLNPANAGFCIPEGQCLPSGLLNASNTYYGAPVVFSNPHFLYCDQDMIDSVWGMYPDPETHSSYLSLEPLTGMTMEGSNKLQINIYLEQIEGFRETENLQPLYLPIMWIDKNAVITEVEATKFKYQVLRVVDITVWVKYGLLCMGGLMLACAVTIFFAPRFQSPHADASNPQKGKYSDGKYGKKMANYTAGDETDDDDDAPLILRQNHAEINDRLLRY